MHGIHTARSGGSLPVSPQALLQRQDSTSTPRYGKHVSQAYGGAPSSSGGSRRWHLLLLVVLLLAAAAAVAGGGRTLVQWHSRRTRAPVLYALVIDCGSSGTRIYAYNWTQPPAATTGAVFPVVAPIPPSAAAHLVPQHASKGMYNRVETRPGLDAFAAAAAAAAAGDTSASSAASSTAADGLSAALGPLLAWARAVVPPHRHASTPLFLMATGGLRRLPAEQQATLLAQVRQLLGQSGFRFETNWARVISGEDEGAFGWLALNYQQGRLRPHTQPAAAALAQGPSKAAAAEGSLSAAPTITSLGALDLGGSSLQITFEVPAPLSNAVQPPQYNISVAGHTFLLHLHSFKNYGLNEAYDRGVTVLLQRQHQQQQASTAASALAAPGLIDAGSNSSTAVETTASSSSSGGTSTTATAAPLQYPADLAGREQHDIAVARAAGVTTDVTISGQPAAASATASMQQQARQADLAAAAAAGYHTHGADDPLEEGSIDTRSGSSGSHTGLQPVGPLTEPDHSSDRSSSGEGPASLGLRLLAQDGQGHSAAGGAAAAMRRQASRRLRRSLLQQQLQWLEAQLLRTGAAPGGALQQQQQGLHDVRLRQLLREYLIRDDPPAASAHHTPSHTANSSSSSSSRIGTSTDGGDDTAAPPPVVPVDAGSSTSSGGPDKLPVVLHPCLHKGYEAVYERVTYAAITPQPPKVLLRGLPDWDACLQLVDSVVNASAPCAVQEHAPSCVLGTAQPELHGHFMALTGFYVVSHFLNVSSADSSTTALEQLLDAAKTLCSRPWSWAQQNLGSHVNVERYCSWGPYVVKLLLQGLGLEEQQVMLPQDGDLGWPLGAVLVEASNLPGFSAVGVRQRQDRPHRGSLRGTGVLQQQQQQHMQAAPAATAALGPPPAGSSAAPAVHHLEHELQPTAHGGPPWSLGLLHHNQSSPGLHLSGPGWGLFAVGVAWLLIMAWCRGVGSTKSLLPLTVLGAGGTGGGSGGAGGRGDRPHVGGYSAAVRGKVSPSRFVFKPGSSK